MKCSACGSRDIDFQESGGHSYCVSCGNLVEESTIVSSIEFQESGDRSQVIGQFVAANCSRPFSSGARSGGRFGSGRESREATIFRMRQIITQTAASLNLPEDGIIDRALGLYQLAMEKNFVFGRRQIHVACTCLYAICRKESKPHLLIDFSDALQINVFVLGKSFLQFLRMLHLKLPIIDPCLYIHRYALRLELGDKFNSVITVALRIVTRLKKDWIVMGRRPHGICAAAMLISSRAHGFGPTQKEIMDIFRISGDTLKRRLTEFKSIPSAQLSVTQLFTVDSSVEFDPPAYIRNLLADVDLTDNLLQWNLSDNPDERVTVDPVAMRAGGKRDQQDEFAIERVHEIELENELKGYMPPNDHEEGRNYAARNNSSNDRDETDNQSFGGATAHNVNQSAITTVLGDVVVAVPVQLPKSAKGITRRKLEIEKRAQLLYADIGRELTVTNESLKQAHTKLRQRKRNEEVASMQNFDEINDYYHEEYKESGDAEKNADSDEHAENDECPDDADDGKDAYEMGKVEEDEEDDFGELDMYILSEEEQQKRAAIWEKSFRGYVDEMTVKRNLRESEAADRRAGVGRNGAKPRKKNERRSGGGPSRPSTTSQAVLNSDAKIARRTSRKINYEALMGSFDSEGNFVAPTIPTPTGPTLVPVGSGHVDSQTTVTMNSMSSQIVSTIIHDRVATKVKRARIASNKSGSVPADSSLSSTAILPITTGTSDTSSTFAAAAATASAINVSSADDIENEEYMEDEFEYEDNYGRDTIGDDYDEEYY